MKNYASGKNYTLGIVKGKIIEEDGEEDEEDDD